MSSENTVLYEIRRFYKEAHKGYDVIRQGLTLKEAQAWCTDPRTSNLEDGWFDGYSEFQTEGGITLKWSPTDDWRVYLR